MAIIATALAFHSKSVIALFFVFGIAGIIGESGFSMWWKAFFQKRIWVYETDTMFNSYTSILNFFPWAMSGFLFVFITNKLGMQEELFNQFAEPWNLMLIFIAGLAVSFILAYIIQKRRKLSVEMEDFNLWTYLIFCIPTLAAAAYLTAINTRFLYLSLAFGLGSFIAEYLLGKYIEFFLSKKLWYYSYATVDHKHTTPTNIIPFVFAGFYFMAIYYLFSALV